MELVIKANDVLISNDQRSSVAVTEQLKYDFHDFWQKYEKKPLHGRNEILASFCPQVYGLYLVKLAVSLVLIGGVQRVKESGTRIRGESHLLLVGDPGIFMNFFLFLEVKIKYKNLCLVLL